MRIQVAKPLFAWSCLKDSPTLKTIKQLLDILQSLLQRIEDTAITRCGEATQGIFSENGKPREAPPGKKCLDGKLEAKVIALRLGSPPKGCSNWSLRLLAEHVIELGLVDSISHDTLRQTLKKTE